ncbi:hypothetical protein BDR07DRAFT_378850 [Suillus spraguei]|nr:hypothetical protein BDR07DRAFT_378850 [Suillus spraguei]
MCGNSARVTSGTYFRRCRQLRTLKPNSWVKKEATVTEGLARKLRGTERKRSVRRRPIVTKNDFSLILDPFSVNCPRKPCVLMHVRSDIDSMGTWKRTAHACQTETNSSCMAVEHTGSRCPVRDMQLLGSDGLRRYTGQVSSHRNEFVDQPRSIDIAWIVFRIHLEERRTS